MKNTCRQLVTTDYKAGPCSQHTKFIRLPNFSKLRLIALSALTLPMLAMAGNIPQYKVSKGGTPYTEITDGTALAMTFNGNAVLFATGGMFYGSEVTRPGFPIGFDFRLGGQLFDQFGITNNGDIFLGKGEVAYGTTAFRLGMSTLTCGLYKAEVSYKTEGEEGQRILTIQYKDAVLNETTKNKGKYNLQLRLYEADGKIEMAFNETETCYGLGGFVTGLRGFDDDDTLLITAAGLDKPVSISPWSKGGILEADSYINWDSNDYDNDYSPVFVFTPDNNTVAPKGAPQNLSVEQKEDNVLISCLRGADAKTTVVLISEQPFTDNDLPVDGETFRAGQDSKGNWPTKFGNATAVYYGNDEEISLTVPGLEAGKTYYICAISANGYPAYNREGRAEQVLASSQAAPEGLRVSSNSADELNIYCKADYPVIIAATTEGRKEYGAGYAGVFGTPAADVSVGDELPNGGTVVYVGEPGNTVKVDALPNALTFFRAWTVDGDRVSATYADGTGIPLPSFPYEPHVENYPLGERLWGWTHSNGEEFVPLERAYGHDRAICATSIDDTEYTLRTPFFTSYRDMTLTFDFAMETEKEAAVGEEGQVMMQGFEPGHFDETGYFHILSGDNVLKDITEYNGTMKTVPRTGGNEDGSSSFETVEVEIPHTGEAQTVTFAFSTPKKSRLYIRNISIKQTGEAPALPENAPANLLISYADGDNEGVVNVKADRAEDAHGTLLLLSVGDFEGTPEDGKTYKNGDQIGNGTVLYHGTDDHIEAASIPVEGEKEYVLTGFSHNVEGHFGTAKSTARLITTGIEIVSDENLDLTNAAIYNVAGIRVNITDASQLSAGLYIINGKKVIIKNK